ncbi:hypothetical protein [Dictyobacter formicarum]|nr:hypothetical protein [Dictyobacter formicarum]
MNWEMRRSEGLIRSAGSSHEREMPGDARRTDRERGWKPQKTA